MKTQLIYMTPSGRAHSIETLTRKLWEYDQICAERAIAHELSGDGWHDNPHFNRLQQLEADKSREVASLKANISNARIVHVDINDRPTDAVRIGSIVQLSTRTNSSNCALRRTWEIVGFDETDLATMKLAYNSPLGQAIIGHEEGEEVAVNLAEGLTTVVIEALLTESVTSDHR